MELRNYELNYNSLNYNTSANNESGEIFEQSPDILVDGRFQPATFLLPEGPGGSRRVLGRPMDLGYRLPAVDTSVTHE